MEKIARFLLVIGAIGSLLVIWTFWPTYEVTITEDELWARSSWNIELDPIMKFLKLPLGTLSLKDGRSWGLSIEAGNKLHQLIDWPLVPARREPSFEEKVEIKFHILYLFNWITGVEVNPPIKWIPVS